MKSLREIELQLKQAGLHNQFWCKPEIKELVHILTDDEIITKAVNGRYQGGFALLVITNHRLLLVDKKLWFMSLEDTRFDMITEVDYAARVFNATMSVRTVNKNFHFTSLHHGQLRELTKYLQERIMELRQLMLQQADYSAQQNPALGALQNTMAPIVPLDAPQSQVTSTQTSVQPTQPVSSTQFYSSPVQYTRPTRLRRLGALPASSLTMQQQRFARH